jgi:hypothetical protein
LLSVIAPPVFFIVRFSLTVSTTLRLDHSALRFIDWSPFNVGVQLDLVSTNFLASVAGPAVPCTSIPSLPNGIQIFPGSVPLYKNGVLVGAIGISGDGVDQDDLIAAAGANGFSPPQQFVRIKSLCAACVCRF